MKKKAFSGIGIGPFIATLLLAHLALSPLAWSQPFQIQARALSGTDRVLGPGLGQGVFFNSISDYFVNENGHVSFSSTLTGTGVSAANDRGIWMGHQGGLANVARRGDQVSGAAPDTLFQTFEYMAPFSGSQGGLFTATLAGTGTDSSNNQGLWSIAPTTFSLSSIARKGDSVPGFGSDFRYSYFYPNIARNSHGQTAFSVEITGPGIDQNNGNLMMRMDQGQVSMIARRGDAASGVSGTFWNLSNQLRINPSGQVAFNASVISGTNQNYGVWVAPTTQPELRATSFQSAPGTNRSFFNFGPPVTNDLGAVAFWATLGSSGIEDNGIWSNASGNLSLVARTGQQAAGTGFGVQFSDFSFGERMMLDGLGQTYFEATLQGAGVSTANDRGFWRESQGSLSLLAREGDLAPGLSGTANFSGLSGLVVNSGGQFAFIGTVTGSGIDNTNNRGLWASDLDGNLHLLVRRGEQFNISGDPNNPEWRTISNVFMNSFFSGGEDGIRNNFNNQGQLAFRLNFTDGTHGIFVANTWSAVPEPASFLVLMALATGVALRRRRRSI